MGQRLLPQEKLRARFDLYLSATELALIKEKSDASKLATSAYIRNAALGHTVNAPPNLLTAQALREISRIGGNINQIAVLAAVGKAHQIDQNQLLVLSNEIRAIWNELKEKSAAPKNDCES